MYHKVKYGQKAHSQKSRTIHTYIQRNTFLLIKGPFETISGRFHQTADLSEWTVTSQINTSLTLTLFPNYPFKVSVTWLMKGITQFSET